MLHGCISKLIIKTTVPYKRLMIRVRPWFLLHGGAMTELESTKTYEQTNSFSNECLGSYNDEERSEMRYVMRIARSASHQNFERSLHFLEKCVCWSVCVSPTLVHILLRIRIDAAVVWHLHHDAEPVRCKDVYKLPFSMPEVLLSA